MIGPLTVLVAVLLALVAVVRWHRRGQSVRKGLGLSLSPYAVADLVVGVVITGIALIGVFSAEILLGGIAVTWTGPPTGWAQDVQGLLLVVLVEEVVLRALLLNGLVAVLGGRPWPALAVSALVVGLLHLTLPQATTASAVGNALGALFYGIAFLGGKNIWLPLGLHAGWLLTEGPLLGFPRVGLDLGGLFTQVDHGPVDLTGGGLGPEAGLVGMAARVLVLVAVVGYLSYRSHERGRLRSLEFPIDAYANPATTRP